MTEEAFDPFVGVGSIKTTIGEVFLFVDPNRVGMGVAANPIADVLFKFGAEKGVSAIRC